MNRLLRVAFGALVAVLSLASPAAADAPGPTDYLSEVVGVEPETNAVSLRMIGGDSFLELVVEPGHTVDVVGYRGELYLRFEADGTVLENQRSPSKYLNEERYGTDVGPVDATPDAEPLWEEVADDGRFAWHDHRTHWMNEKKPAGAEAGDIILEQVVPLVVDGAEVKVTVVSTLQEPPGPTGVLLGGVVAAGVSLALFRRLLPGAPVLWLGLGSGLALIFGLMAYTAVPAETGPSMLLWAAPLLACVAAFVGFVKRDGFLGDGLLLLAGAGLALWGWTRRGALSAAIIPSDAPDLADRAVVMLSLLGGAIAMAAGLWAVVRVLTQPVPVPATNG